MAAATGAGGIGIRIVEIPVAVKDNPQSSIYIVNRLSPSEVISQKIEVSNSTNSPMSVAIYPGAATNVIGTFAASPGATGNQLTSWISITPSQAVLPAHSYLTARVTFTVPSDAPSGEQYGVIWAATSSSGNLGNITNVNRVGIRIYAPIGKSITNTTTASGIKTDTTPLNSGDLQWFTTVMIVLVGILFVLSQVKRWWIALGKRRRREKERSLAGSRL